METSELSSGGRLIKKSFLLGNGDTNGKFRVNYPLPWEKTVSKKETVDFCCDFVDTNRRRLCESFQSSGSFAFNFLSFPFIPKHVIRARLVKVSEQFQSHSKVDRIISLQCSKPARFRSLFNA